MNKRQRKKNWCKYISGTRRFGCEECFGVTNRIMKTDFGWINASIKLEKCKNKLTNKFIWKMKLMQKDFNTGEREEIAYIEPKYCWNCGRKLK